jgi:predicted nucleic acid-binding protein
VWLALQKTALAFYEFGGYQLCLRAANNYRILRRQGITVRKAIDVIIATGCIEWNLELLHNDRDFVPMEQILGLKVVRLA